MILNKYYKYQLIIYCCLAISSLTGGNLAIAQPENYLEKIEGRDPLIPQAYGKRALSSWEKYRIKQKIQELEQTATLAIEQDEIDRAMKLRYRQLNLIRVLDTTAEIKALAQVGAIAWSENRRQDLRNIAQRLVDIEAESTEKNQVSLKMAHQLAIAYQEIHYTDRAIAIYQQILAKQKPAGNVLVTQETLATLGRLYLAIFDYENARVIYQQLLTNASNQQQQETYLLTLIKIQENSGKLDQAIANRNRLISQYLPQKKLSAIAHLKMAIARDYQTLQHSKLAINTYQEAWQISLKTKQLEISSNALNSLGQIYQQENLWQQAIWNYQQLIPIQEQANNYYGLINTYDTLGKINLQLKQNSAAKKYFQQGLSLAKTLNHQTEYFNHQLNQIPKQ